MWGPSVSGRHRRSWSHVTRKWCHMSGSQSSECNWNNVLVAYGPFLKPIEAAHSLCGLQKAPPRQSCRLPSEQWAFSGARLRWSYRHPAADPLAWNLLCWGIVRSTAFGQLLLPPTPDSDWLKIRFVGSSQPQILEMMSLPGTLLLPFILVSGGEVPWG